MNAYYIVKIEVYADPSLPSITAEELSRNDSGSDMAKLIAELNQYSTEELQDLVHKKFEYRLCRKCQLKFNANPLGLPRAENPGQN